MRAPSTLNGSGGSPGSPGQQTAHTPAAVTATDAPTGLIGTRAATRLVAGSMRTSPTPGTAPQTMPAPTATPRRQIAADCPVPATVATTWLLRGSTRKTSQRAAHTASGPTAIALTASHGGSWTRPGSGILAKTGDAAVIRLAGWVAGGPADRRLPLVRRPTATKAITTAAIPATVTSRLWDSLLISPPHRYSANPPSPVAQRRSLPGAVGRHAATRSPGSACRSGLVGFAHVWDGARLHLPGAVGGGPGGRSGRPGDLRRGNHGRPGRPPAVLHRLRRRRRAGRDRAARRRQRRPGPLLQPTARRAARPGGHLRWGPSPVRVVLWLLRRLRPPGRAVRRA